MKYVLLKMPNKSIIIVDNSTYIGKDRVCKLVDEGATSAGTIESDLKPAELKWGFEEPVRETLEEQYYKIRLAQEALDGDITWDGVHPPKEEPKNIYKKGK